MITRKLLVNDGRREREMLLVGTLVVGRDPVCDITADDALLSRRHAELVACGERVTVRDLGSRNGVFVNGARTPERLLRPGDVVQIGHLRLTYVAGSSAPDVEPERSDVEVTALIPGPPASAVTSPIVRPVRAGYDATGVIASSNRPAEPPRSLKAFVIVQVSVLAGVVFLLPALALIVRHDRAASGAETTGGLLYWLAVPAAAAVAVTWATAIRISTRLLHHMDALRRNTPPEPGARRDAAAEQLRRVHS